MKISLHNNVVFLLISKGLEVIIALLIVRVGVEAFHLFTFLGKWEIKHNLYLSFGWALIAVSCLMLVINRTRFRDVGLDLRLWRQDYMRTASWISRKFHISPAFVVVFPFVLVVFFFFIGLGNLGMLGVSKLIACQVFATALGEEICFRGYIQGSFDRITKYRFIGISLSVFITSIFFGLLHAFNSVSFFYSHYDFAWWISIQTTIIGIFYGILREKSGSIVPGIFIHALVNIFFFSTMPELSQSIINN